MNQFEHLFAPIKIGAVEVRNRIVAPAYGTARLCTDPSGERWMYHHVEKAKGGVGLIVTGDIDVHPTSIHPNTVGLHPSTLQPTYSIGLASVLMSRKLLPVLKRTTEMVHEHGARIVCQAGHAGRQMTSLWTRMALWAPSPVPCPLNREYPHEMGIAEIRELQQATADAYALAQEGGYDGGELHGAHGFLISEFLSPFSNQRTDDYGGSPENRMRYLSEVIDLVRQKCGRDFVLGIRLSGDEMTPGGLTLSDMQEICRRLEERGQLDYISISAGNNWRLNTSTYIGPDMSFPPGLNVPIASAIKSVLKRTPVLVAGRINEPVQAEKVLADGHADMIAMARALLCDPEWPNKARDGRPEAIRKCMACAQGCVGRRYRGEETRCIQNPAAGEEKELGIGTLKRAPVVKNVVVIGGGPAGMKAAEIAAARGHKVTLYEKNNEMGGHVNILVKAPSQKEFGEVTRYLEYRVKELGITVKLGTTATPEMVLAEKPDAVVVAAGSEASKPPIPGASQPNFVTTRDVLQGKATVGNKVVITDEGDNHWEFCGTAEMLAKQGKQVEMITKNYYAGFDLPLFSIGPLHERLFKLGVAISPLSILKEINGNTVTVTNYYTSAERKIENVDTVVSIPARRAADGLYRALKGKVKEIYAIGDCNAPRKVESAIVEGEKTGRRL